MTRAVVIPVDAPPYETILNTPPGHEELSAIVGGWIEAIWTTTGDMMFLDEEGKLKGLPVNATATLLSTADMIVGTAVLLGPPDEDGNNTDATTQVEIP